MAFTESNQLLYGNHQAGSYGGCSQYSPQQQNDSPSEEDQKIAALRNEINNKIDRLAKNEDKDFIKGAFNTENTNDLKE